MAMLIKLYIKIFRENPVRTVNNKIKIIKIIAVGGPGFLGFSPKLATEYVPLSLVS